MHCRRENGIVCTRSSPPKEGIYGRGWLSAQFQDKENCCDFLVACFSPLVARGTWLQDGGQFENRVFWVLVFCVGIAPSMEAQKGPLHKSLDIKFQP